MITLIIVIILWIACGLTSRYLQKIYLPNSNDEGITLADDITMGPFAFLIVLFAIIDREN